MCVSEADKGGRIIRGKGGTFFPGPALSGAACVHVRGPHFCLPGYRRPIVALEHGFAKNNSRFNVKQFRYSRT
jgi:hypothetical protein